MEELMKKEMNVTEKRNEWETDALACICMDERDCRFDSLFRVAKTTTTQKSLFHLYADKHSPQEATKASSQWKQQRGRGIFFNIAVK